MIMASLLLMVMVGVLGLLGEVQGVLGVLGEVQGGQGMAVSPSGGYRGLVVKVDRRVEEARCRGLLQGLKVRG